MNNFFLKIGHKNKTVIKERQSELSGSFVSWSMGIITLDGNIYLMAFFGAQSELRVMILKTFFTHWDWVKHPFISQNEGACSLLLETL